MKSGSKIPEVAPTGRSYNSFGQTGDMGNTTVKLAPLSLEQSRWNSRVSRETGGWEKGDKKEEGMLEERF